VLANATLVAVRELWANRFEVDNTYKDADKEDVKDPAPLTEVEDIKRMTKDFDNVLNKRPGSSGAERLCLTSQRAL